MVDFSFEKFKKFGSGVRLVVVNHYQSTDKYIINYVSNGKRFAFNFTEDSVEKFLIAYPAIRLVENEVVAKPIAKPIENEVVAKPTVAKRVFNPTIISESKPPFRFFEHKGVEAPKPKELDYVLITPDGVRHEIYKENKKSHRLISVHCKPGRKPMTEEQKAHAKAERDAQPKIIETTFFVDSPSGKVEVLLRYNKKNPFDSNRKAYKKVNGALVEL